MTTLSARDQSEILRSASEAAKADLTTLAQSELERYRNPPASTPYGLEYAFHLLGDVRNKTVLDLGCGQGENSIALMAREAYVIGLDISPELIEIARKRRRKSGYSAFGSMLLCESAYETGLPENSVDVIFCIALIHHLEIPKVQKEMLRILKPGGFVILKEPIRFSRAYAWLRSFFPEQADVSDFEHPLTQEELEVMCWPFKTECLRYFRLPFVPLVARSIVKTLFPKAEHWAIRWSARFLERWPSLEKYATEVVVRLGKTENLLGLRSVA